MTCGLLDDFLRRSFGDDGAELEGEHAVRDAHHQRHVVLDHHDRAPGSSGPDALDDSAPRASASRCAMPDDGSSRRRTEGSGPAGTRARRCAACRSRARRRTVRGTRPGPSARSARRRAPESLLDRRPPGPKLRRGRPGSRWRSQADRDHLGDRQGREQARVLERPPEAESAPGVRRRSGDVVTAEQRPGHRRRRGNPRRSRTGSSCRRRSGRSGRGSGPRAGGGRHRPRP